MVEVMADVDIHSGLHNWSLEWISNSDKVDYFLIIILVITRLLLDQTAAI